MKRALADLYEAPDERKMSAEEYAEALAAYKPRPDLKLIAD